MSSIISITNLSKTYGSGFKALKTVNLDIRRGEIFALLGPNGAGKTTLISIICGIANPSEGSVTVDGHDIGSDYRAARSLIGLVPQELHTDAFESVWATRQLQPRPVRQADRSRAHREGAQDLSLWDKKDNKIVTLSGGMKRRVMIAKALSHEPKILFLDEPTAGVDVELRKGMWEVVRTLQASGVTIILTTHYIDEAEQMADRIGVINKGEIVLVEDKTGLMQKLGRKQLKLHLQNSIDAIPPALAAYNLELSNDGCELTYHYDTQGERTFITSLLSDLRDAGIRFYDLDTVAEFAGRHLRQPGEDAVNFYAIRAIYRFEMARTWRTLLQSIVSPVVSTSLYFVVFGAAIGSRITSVEGVSYGTFIVPGLVMLSVLTQSIANASFGIYFPKFVGTIYELLSAPVSYLEIVLGYVGAAATKSIVLGLIILATAGLFVPLQIASSLVDAGLSGADRRDLQPVRLHHRDLG